MHGQGHRRGGGGPIALRATGRPVLRSWWWLPLLGLVLLALVSVVLARPGEDRQAGITVFAAASLREDNAALDAWADRLEVEAGPAQVTAPIQSLERIPAAVGVRVMRRMALEAGCPGAAITREHLMSVYALVTAWHGQGPIDLPGGVRARRESGSLVLHRASGRRSAR